MRLRHARYWLSRVRRSATGVGRGMVVIGLASWLAAGSGTSAQDTLARARDLYVLASYDEALALLDRLRSTATAGEASEIGGYQVFCLLALGRTTEAQQAIEALVKTDPLYRPSESIASPRVRAVYDEVRRGLLPGIVQDSYDKAKGAFDKGESQAALAEFDRVLLLLKDPDLSDLPNMADLRRLATGFRDLSLAAAAAASAAPADGKAGAPPADGNAGPPPAAPPPPVLYSAANPDVVAPVSVSRDTPPWRPRSALDARREYPGVIAVEINEKGDVTSAALVKSVHRDYDDALLKMARTWKFRPATKDGVPVAYRLEIAIRLRPSGT